jgi:aspartate racemase
MGTYTASDGFRSSPVGIIGGVGPRATAILYQDVVFRCAAAMDGQYPAVALWSMPLQPRLDDALIGGASAGREDRGVTEALRVAVARLADVGASPLALPCNTLQRTFLSVASSLEVEALDMIGSTAARCAERGARVGVLATPATRSACAYDSALAGIRAEAVYPAGPRQALVNEAIAACVHGGDLRLAGRRLREVARSLHKSVDVVLLACTDLSGLLPDPVGSRPVVDSLACLADDVVARVHLVHEARIDAGPRSVLHEGAPGPRSERILGRGRDARAGRGIPVRRERDGGADTSRDQRSGS